MSTQVEVPREQSWRQIRQAVSGRAMTRQGRKRFRGNVVRATFSVLTIGTLAALGVYFWQGFERPSETLAPVVKAEPLREVVLIANGVLDKAWVMERLALPEGIALMAIDLELARLRLEREGQVRNAVIARDFPRTLVVTLQERVPVVRIMIPIEPGRPEAFFVGRDGVVYRGFNYDPKMVASLPWLDGVRLKRQGDGFEDLKGLDRVSELLLAARNEAPHLASDWRIVSLAELPLLIVRTNEVAEIVFEAGSYRRQLARLDYILDHYREQGPLSGVLERIDLSIASQVAVHLAASARPALAGNSAADGRGAGFDLTEDDLARTRPAPLFQPQNSLIRNIPNTQSNRGFQR